MVWLMRAVCATATRPSIRRPPHKPCGELRNARTARGHAARNRMFAELALA